MPCGDAGLTGVPILLALQAASTSFTHASQTVADAGHAEGAFDPPIPEKAPPLVLRI
jgi:hypothetical protein